MLNLIVIDLIILPNSLTWTNYPDTSREYDDKHN